MPNDFSADSSVKALFRFESGALTADSSGNGNTLTAEGTPTASATCKEGSYSVDYSGSNMCHYRQNADLSAGFPLKSGDTTKKMSICFWMRADTIPGAGNYDEIVIKGNSSDTTKHSWVVRMQNSLLYFAWFYGAASGAETQTLYATPAASRWYHVGIALDGVNKTFLWRVWDDTAGSIVSSGTWIPTNVLRATDAQLTVAAAYQTINHTNYYDGKVDELVIFDRLITATEIDDIRQGLYDSSVEYDDGTSSGGLVVGGTGSGPVVRVEGYSSGGLVVGGTDSPVVVCVDPPASGGLVVGGTDSMQWSNPWSVAVRGGTYRIAGTIYTLANTLYFTGLGDIAAIVNASTPPATPGQFRYDILVIGVDGAIHVVAGTAAATPVMPATTTSHVKINHILRYYGQTRIEQSDIGRNFIAPMATRVDVTASDDELTWAEATSTLTVNIYDQYGALYLSDVVINASFLIGNGTLAPMSASTATGVATFLYTRGGADPGDISPIIRFSVAGGAVGTVLITLLDAGGSIMA